jgi:hypothetical protein
VLTARGDISPSGGTLRGTKAGMMLEYYRGAFAEGSRGYQVIAFATPETFGKLRDEITGILKSFHSRRDLAR